MFIETSFASIFLQTWISQSTWVARSKLSLALPSPSSINLSRRPLDSVSFKRLPGSAKREYAGCVLLSCRNTWPIIVGCFPSSLGIATRRWYEIDMTLYRPKLDVGSTLGISHQASWYIITWHHEVFLSSMTLHLGAKFVAHVDATNLLWIASHFLLYIFFVFNATHKKN